jgi:hypothetical protein
MSLNHEPSVSLSVAFTFLSAAKLSECRYCSLWRSIPIQRQTSTDSVTNAIVLRWADFFSYSSLSPVCTTWFEQRALMTYTIMFIHSEAQTFHTFNLVFQKRLIQSGKKYLNINHVIFTT